MTTAPNSNDLLFKTICEIVAKEKEIPYLESRYKAFHQKDYDRRRYYGMLDNTFDAYSDYKKVYEKFEAKVYSIEDAINDMILEFNER